MIEFTNKTIVVTGATSGIGKATAQHLATHNAHLVLVARDGQKLELLKDSLPFSNRHFCLPCDLLCDAHRLFELLAALIDVPVDGAVHSAGMRILEPLQIGTDKTWEDTYFLNTIAAMHLIKAIKKYNKKASSSIVLIASIAGIVGNPAISAYCASKGALIAAARAWALEMAQHNIRINTVSPGYLQSEMLQNHKKMMTAQSYNKIVMQHPLGLGTPDDVAHAVLFFLSQGSRWITGANLVVDGGYCAQ